MAPEYAIDGIFSIKSDAFSYGILLLELVSGKKSRGFHHPDHNFSLIGHVSEYPYICFSTNFQETLSLFDNFKMIKSWMKNEFLYILGMEIMERRQAFGTDWSILWRIM